jgi:hypothetical protein
MSLCKFLSLEEPRQSDDFKQFGKKHPSSADRDGLATLSCPHYSSLKSSMMYRP